MAFVTPKTNPLQPNKGGKSKSLRFLFSEEFNEKDDKFGFSDEEKKAKLAMIMGKGLDEGRERLIKHSEDNVKADAEDAERTRRAGYSQGSGLDRWAQLQEKPFGSTRMGKRALPESFSHKLGVAARRARRLGISPNNNTLMNALIQGREQDAGIEQHDAEIAEGKAKEGFLDRTEKEDRADGQRFADQDDELDVDANVDEDEDEESNIVKAGSSRSNIKSSSRNRTFDR